MIVYHGAFVPGNLDLFRGRLRLLISIRGRPPRGFEGEPAKRSPRRHGAMIPLVFVLLAAGLWICSSGKAQIETDAFISNAFTDDVTVINTQVPGGTVVQQSVALGGSQIVPSGVAATPDGRYVYVANQGAGTVSVLNATTYQVVGTIPVGAGPVGVTVTPDGKFAYVTNQFDNSVSIINTTTNRVVGNPIPLQSSSEGAPYGIAVTPGGQYIYVANSITNEVSVISTSTDQIVARPNVLGNPIAVTVSANGQYAYVTSNTNTVSVINTSTNQVISSYQINPRANPYGIAVTSDGRFAYIANDNSNTVTVINAMTGVVVIDIFVGNLPVGVSITPAGQYVYVTNLGDGTVSVISTASNTVVNTITTGNGSSPIGSGAFSLGSFIGPNIIVAKGGPLLISNDAALSSLGFGGFLDFNGGTLKLTGNLTTSRTISLLAQGGTIDTNGFNAIVSGDIVSFLSGSLTKSGSGTLTLSGQNSYDGSTIVNGGTLQAGSTTGFSPNSAFTINQRGILDLGGFSNTVGSLAGSGNVINSGSAAAVLSVGQNNTSTTFSGTLSDGDGKLGLNKIGSGTFTLSGSSSYSGPTTISGGTLVAAHNSALGTGLVEIAGVPETLEILSGVSISNQISFSGGGVLLNAGTINGQVRSSGVQAASETLVNSGVINGNVELGNAANLVHLYTGGSIHGNLSLGSANGTALVLDGNGNQNLSQAVSGTISNNGSLTKQGGGSWTLDKALSAPVGTNILEGALIVNSTLTTSQLNVLNGAALMGSGLIAGNVVNSGILSPGNSPGTISISGNYTQNPAGTLAIQIASSTNFDRVEVAGKTNLNGTLAVSLLDGFVPQQGQEFVFLTAGGGVSGEFSSVQGPVGTLNFTVQYAPDDVSLRFEFVPFQTFAQNFNEFSVASALQSVRFSAQGDLASVIGILDFLPVDQLRRSFDVISPQLVPTLSTVAFTLESAQAAQLEQRMATIRAGDGDFQRSDAQIVSSPQSTESTNGKEVYQPPKMVEVAHGDRWGAFLAVSGTFANVDRVTDLLNYTFDTVAVITGLDYRFTPNAAIGFYAGHGFTWVRYDFADRINIADTKFGLYSTWKRGAFYIDGILGGGYNSYDARRGIVFSGIDRSARSSPEAWEFDAVGQVGYDWKFGHFTGGAFGSWQYVLFERNSFIENGADSLDLVVSSDEANSIRQLAGARLSYSWNVLPELTVTPELSMAWQHEYLDEGRTIYATLEDGSGPTFSIRKGRAARDSAFGEASMTTTWHKVTAFISYNPEFGSGSVVSQTVSGGFSITF
jgi:YVTN family beta-propeller protein/autotransporter-associated beta strand protein